MGHADVLSTVTAVVGLLLIAAVAAIILKRTRLPFTVGLVLTGIGLRVIGDRVDGLDLVTEFELSPEIILFIFLPTLVFESAFNLDSQLLTRNLTPVLALAAPGLLLSTAIVGGLVSLLTPLPIGPALLFGALISATDPVAVVALFRDLGAPKRLATLVEGESLFNDATAIVLFHIILGVVVGGGLTQDTLAQGFLDFLFVFAGGVLVGCAIGYLMIRSIALADDQPLVEVALSTVVAYMAFIAAEHYLHVSGVMAVVGAGIMVGTLGSTRFSPQLREYLHQFWEFAAFVANSLIFLLVGLSVSSDTLVRHGTSIGWAIVAVMLARGFTVYFVLPLVSRGQQRIDVRYQTVIFWGGLRGAVALALAFSLAPDFEHRELLVSLSVGVVLFTILAGGVTMQPLIRRLGLNEPSLVEQVARSQAALAAKREAVARLDRMAENGHVSETLLKEMRRGFVEEVSETQAKLTSLRSECAAEDMRTALWAEAVTVEATAYRQLFDHGAISELVLHQLEAAVDLEREALRRGELPVRQPDVHTAEIRYPEVFFSLLGRVLPRLRIVQAHRLKTLSVRHEHDSAILSASRHVADEVERLADLSGADQTMAHELRDAFAERAREAMERIDSIAEHFPEYARAVQRQAARRTALDGEADAIEELAAQGGIPQTIADEARRSVEAELKQLARQPIVARAPAADELIASVPFFRGLSPEDRSGLVEKMTPRTALAGETIISQGETGRSLFMISRGVVAVSVERRGGRSRRVASLHSGDFFGEMALLTADRRSATVSAISDCQLFELSRADVDELRHVVPAVDRALIAAFEVRRVELRTTISASDSSDHGTANGG